MKKQKIYKINSNKKLKKLEQKYHKLYQKYNKKYETKVNQFNKLLSKQKLDFVFEKFYKISMKLDKICAEKKYYDRLATHYYDKCNAVSNLIDNLYE